MRPPSRVSRFLVVVAVAVAATVLPTEAAAQSSHPIGPQSLEIDVVTLVPVDADGELVRALAQLRDTVIATIVEDPNLTLRADAGRQLEWDASKVEPAISTALSGSGDFLVVASISLALDATVGHALLVLMRPSDQEMLGAFPFVWHVADREALVEIGLQALMAPVLRSHLGVLRVRIDARPSDVTLRRPTGGPSAEAHAAGIFTTHALRAGPGLELISDLLLAGEYTVTIRVPGLDTIERSAIVTRGETTLLLVGSGPSESGSPGAGQLASLRVRGMAPGQSVYVERDGAGPSVAVLLSRSRSGRLVAEWARSMERDQIAMESTDDAVLLHHLPTGDYRVHTWLGTRPRIGSAVLLSAGSVATLRLGPEATTVSVAGLEPSDGKGHVNLYFAPFGPPDGAELYVDGRFVAMVFDCGELIVRGLSTGAHRLRFVAAGFDVVVRTMEVMDNGEHALFLRLESVARPNEPRPVD